MTTTTANTTMNRQGVRERYGDATLSDLVRVAESLGVEPSDLVRLAGVLDAPVPAVPGQGRSELVEHLAGLLGVAPEPVEVGGVCQRPGCFAAVDKEAHLAGESHAARVADSCDYGPDGRFVDVRGQGSAWSVHVRAVGEGAWHPELIIQGTPVFSPWAVRGRSWDMATTVKPGRMARALEEARMIADALNGGCTARGARRLFKAARWLEQVNE